MANMGDIVKTAIIIDFFLQPGETSDLLLKKLKWPGISVLTLITLVSVLPAIAEIATIAACIALWYRIFKIDIKIIMAIKVLMTVKFIMAV